MNETPEMSSGTEPKKNKNVFIWVGVALVLCCCSCVGTFVMYQYLGDPIAEALGF
jgi:hypothetical protein